MHMLSLTWGRMAATCLLAITVAACSTVPKPPLSQTANSATQQRMLKLAAVQQFSVEAKLAVQ